MIQSGVSSSRIRAVWHAGLVVLVSGGIIVGVMHCQVAVRALWVFRNNEPLSSWVVIFGGPASTLPATLLAAFHRRASAVWLIGGALASLLGMIANELARGSLVSEAITAAGRFFPAIPCPMILLGLGLVWLDRHLIRNDATAAGPERRHRVLIWWWTTGVYLVLSVLALFVAGLPAFGRALETRSATMLAAPLLGPLMGFAISGILWLPPFLAETVLVLGLLWIAATSRSWSRTALVGAVVSWVLSGLVVLVVSDI